MSIDATTTQAAIDDIDEGFTDFADMGSGTTNAQDLADIAAGKDKLGEALCKVAAIACRHNLTAQCTAACELATAHGVVCEACPS